MNQISWSLLLRRIFAFLGVIGALLLWFIARGSMEFIGAFVQTLPTRGPLGLLLGAFFWLILSLKQPKAGQPAGWWKGLLLCMLGGTVLHLLLGFFFWNGSSELLTIFSFTQILYLILSYILVSLIIGNYAASKAGYRPNELSTLEMGLSLASVFLFLFLFVVTTQKEEIPISMQAKTNFSKLSLEGIGSPTAFYRQGQNLIVASDKGLHHSQDGGQTWSRQGTEQGLLSQDVLSLYEQPEGLLAIFGAMEGKEGGLMRSRDKGKSWEIVEPPKGRGDKIKAWQALQCLSNGFCSTGYETKIVQTHWFRFPGNTWKTSEAETDRMSEGSTFFLANDGPLIYRAQGQHLWRSKDEGRSWQKVALNLEGHESTDHFQFVGLAVEGQQICLAKEHSILRSLDAGQTWKEIDLPFNVMISSFLGFDGKYYASGSQRGLVVFDNRCESPKVDLSYEGSPILLHGKQQLLIGASNGLFVSPVQASN